MAAKPSYTTAQAATQIDRDYVTWNGYGVSNFGKSATVTFAFRATGPFDMPEDTAGFSKFDKAQIDQTLLALKGWSDVANISFTRVGSGDTGSKAYSNDAAMLFGNYSSGEDNAAAFTYFPGSRVSNSVDGDSWYNSTLSYNATPTYLNYGALTLAHEIGHAIGLDHPGDYDATDDSGEITYEADAEYKQDTLQYSIMSYFDESYTGAHYKGYYPEAPQMDDVAAAQRLYGANMSTRTGDTVYGFNSTADRPWFEATKSSSVVIFCVWDAGGTDTFNFSGYTTAAKINLQAEHFSSVGGLKDNVSIAAGVVIENAIGGAGNDSIVGNAAKNVLSGGGGNDTLNGGAGADTLDGGAGSNAASYYHYATGVTVSLGVSGAQKGAGGDSLIAISGLIGSGHADILSAASVSSAATLSGGNGDDTLISGAGADVLNGGSGDDTVSYAGYATGVTVGLGVYGAQSGAGGDALTNIEGLIGSSHADVLSMAAKLGDVTLIGASGDDTLTGGGGSDTLSGGGGADSLIGGGGNDRLYGSTNKDTLSGADGNDRLEGDSNVDVLKGDDGDDTLIGGSSSDTMTGGKGHDVFVFTSLSDSEKSAPDLITGVSSADKIDLSAIDADTTTKGDQAFTLVSKFHKDAGEMILVYDKSHDRTVLSLDVDGDGKADAVIWIGGDAHSFDHFVL